MFKVPKWVIILIWILAPFIIVYELIREKLSGD